LLSGKIYRISFPSDFEVTIAYGSIVRPLRYYADFVKTEGKWVVYMFSEQKIKMMSMITDCVVVVEKVSRRDIYRYTCKEFADRVMEMNE